MVLQGWGEMGREDGSLTFKKNLATFGRASLLELEGATNIMIVRNWFGRRMLSLAAHHHSTGFRFRKNLGCGSGAQYKAGQIEITNKRTYRKSRRTSLSRAPVLEVTDG